jgi:hypothetical protein
VRLGSARPDFQLSSARLGSALLASALGLDRLGSARLDYWLLAQLGSAFFWRSWTMVL